MDCRVKVLAQNKHVQLGLEIWFLLKLQSDDFCLYVNCSNIQKTMLDDTKNSRTKYSITMFILTNLLPSQCGVER